MKAGQKIPRSLLVACCDCPKMLDRIEETLDDIAFAVECEVAVTFDFSI